MVDQMEMETEQVETKQAKMAVMRIIYLIGAEQKVSALLQRQVLTCFYGGGSSSGATGMAAATVNLSFAAINTVQLGLWRCLLAVCP
jgi:hypothetical protein